MTVLYLGSLFFSLLPMLIIFFLFRLNLLSSTPTRPVRRQKLPRKGLSLSASLPLLPPSCKRPIDPNSHLPRGSHWGRLKRSGCSWSKRRRAKKRIWQRNWQGKIAVKFFCFFCFLSVLFSVPSLLPIFHCVPPSPPPPLSSHFSLTQHNTKHTDKRSSLL